MKQRFSSLDVKVIAHELSQSLCTLRLANIYDLSTRIFLFKFAKPDHREQLILETGFRCHLTSFSRETAAAPSSFVARLRKFLRSRRVTSVAQVGTDRIIEIQFSDGQYRLFLEFYAAGNVVLTDSELTVIALHRNVNEGAEHEQLRLGLKYNLSLRQNYGGVPPLSKERLVEGLQKALQKLQDDEVKPKKKQKGKSGDALKKALTLSTTEFPPQLLDHAFHVRKFDVNVKIEDIIQSETLLDDLMHVLLEAKELVTKMTSATTAQGYIIAKMKNSSSDQLPQKDVGSHDSKNLAYQEYHPFKPRQFEGDASLVFLEFDGFNKTVDDFYSSIEGQKLESRLKEREETAQRKIDNARKEHEKRINGLQQVQELHVRKAQAIEGNVDRVEEAVAAINGLIAQGMDWVEISRLIEMEQGRHNPVAQMIKLPLKLYENSATLLLPESKEDEEDFEGNETDSDPSDSEDDNSSVKLQRSLSGSRNTLAVDIDLALSAWSNATQYYDQKKSAAVKEEKTIQSSSKALKNTERKVTADLKKGLKQEKEILRPVRKQFWFEKFMYFISSDGYLVLGGRDAQQNELLYRRYLKKGDVYVHADLNGAASVIIKNKSSTPDAPIPPSTLSQAGTLAVATSQAWETKAVMSAWWVNADQVSKTAPTGEYLTTGGFTIRGKKNFLSPAQLLLGFAVIFHISEESKARHVKHRLQDTAQVKDEGGAADDIGEDTKEKSEDGVENHAEDRLSSHGYDEAAKETLDNLSESSDEDFPDAKLESASEQDEDHESESAQNPLLSNSAAHDESEDDEEDRTDDPTSDPDKCMDTEEGHEIQLQENKEPGDAPQDMISDVSDQHHPESSGKEAPTAGRNSHSHISAHGRKILHKGFTPSSTPNSGAEEEQEENASQISGPAGSSAKSKPLPRGKRSKQKKIASKYADQDEADRALALRLLGHRPRSPQGQGESAPQSPSAKAAARTAALQEQKQRRREQHLKAQEAGLAAEEARRVMLDEGLEVLNDVEEAHTTDLDALVGRPLPGDEIIAALPVCAPWTALASYKYKVKLQPGLTKKGKAVKEILGRWQTDAKDKRKVDENASYVDKIWPREAECIRAWKETEVVGVVPVGKVRTIMPGSKDGGGGASKAKAKVGRGGKGTKKQR